MIEDLWAVIPAAGLGVRAGSVKPKQFVMIRGKTMLEWTARKVMSMPEVGGVVIALPPGYEGHESVKRMVASLTQDHPKDLITVTGGVTRQESVRLALGEIPPRVSWVMVHDASRPFVSEGLTRRVFEAAREYSAAICGIYITDTVKAVVPSRQQSLYFSHSTLSRDGIVTVQTPQVFRLGLLRQCHEIAGRDGFAGTDDSQLVERLGHKVAIVTGERTNFKVTFPEDFKLASVLLETEGAGNVESIETSTLCGFKGGLDSRVDRVKKPRRLRRRYTTAIPVMGFGFDVHPLVPGRRCVLGGVEIPSQKGLSGHSDADVLCHAVADAVLGALSMGDIGKWFPPGDPEFQDAKSLDLLAEIWSAAGRMSEVVHLDCTLVAEIPRLSPHMECMRHNISQVFSISIDKVSIKATSPEKLGSLGEEQGIAAFCAVTLIKKGRV
ncbi:MAG TPA: 2-C-methyl-D-erythritol 4-phosphate cytidylyltransferase [Firmicutes bacterium]|nr:2-C-methyl-D-erythritol 4-phosphate cytidylyltransferase [Candidatus Fermentithermobacillaceae bacterium]